MRHVALGTWLRRLFSSSRPDEEAVVREEYGLHRDDEELRRARYGTFASSEAAEAVDEELEEFERPPDPAP
jgi:hypothetical protein